MWLISDNNFKEFFGFCLWYNESVFKAYTYSQTWEKQLTSNTGTSKKKTVTSNQCYPNSKIETDPKRTRNGPPMGWDGGWGGGVTADDDRGCYDPVDLVWPPHLTPRLTLSSMLFNIEFDVTVFDVPIFDVICLYLKHDFLYTRAIKSVV
jgi:hypothetical protein